VQGGKSTEATLYLNLRIHPVVTISEGARLIAFTSMRYGLDDVFVMNASGWGLTRLPGARGRDFSWSPSGEQIAFGNNGLIAVINVDGSSNPLRLTSPQDNTRNPAWSPDGSQIAFISSAGPTQELRVIGTDGSDERYLADILLTNPHSIAWSPNGSQIAFVTDSDGDRTAELNLIKPDGSGLTRLTSKNPAIWGDGFSWAPDGSRLAFSSTDGLYIVNADGSGMTKLTEDGSVFSPSWSPGGDKIVFIGSFRDRLGLVTLNGQEIYTINPDGSGLTNLTNDDTMRDMNPIWQP
jgi:Tol biopolymer transport system component